MAHIVKKNRLIFFLLAGAAVFVGLVAPFVLPPRFFYDAYTIIYQLVEEGLVGSFEFATLLYTKTGLSHLPFSVIALIQLPVMMYVLYKIGIPEDFNMLNVKNSLVYVSFIIIALYTCMPSKEFITFVYMGLVMIVLKSGNISFRQALIFSFILMFFFGVFFRPYFMIIAILSLSMYLFSFIKVKYKPFAIVAFGIFVICCMSVAFNYLNDEYLTHRTRDFANEFRGNSVDSNSIILSPINADSWYTETISILYGFFSVNLPVNGLKHFLKPQIMAFILWQFLLFIVLFIRLKRSLKNREKNEYLVWGLMILFSYLVIQGVFEPDLGSAVKHRMGMFPLIYYCLYDENTRLFARKPKQDI